jgi:N-acetylmuramoyl-L-alanine amidase
VHPLMVIIARVTPNKSARPDGIKPSLIVIHGTAGKSDRGDVEWCCDPKAKVSYHYVIGRDGKIFQIVPDHWKAWHAGQSIYNGRADCNDYSIGIGLSNDSVEPYKAAQYEACRSLVSMLRTKYDIPLVRVVGHCHISPGRKTDPWLHMEWMKIV